MTQSESEMGLIRWVGLVRHGGVGVCGCVWVGVVGVCMLVSSLPPTCPPLGWRGEGGHFLVYKYTR